MRKISTVFILFLMLQFSAKSQLVSWRLQQSFTVAGLDSFLSSTGFSLPISPQYPVDVYQLIYKTNYKSIDSPMVNASGIVVVPKNTPCPMAMGCYMHGTFSRWDQVPSYNGPERPIGLFFGGIGGVYTVMPDELGLGDSDSSVLIHPYMNGFHSSYAAINLMRAARQFADTMQAQLNGEVILTGYSQGGYTTAATLRRIQENYPNEFNVVGSAPMSGAYDLNNTMINDVMLTNNAYATPAYLPYLLLGYHSVYPNLQQVYPTPSDIFKHPYDSILPPMFYSKNFSTGDIERFCNPVPKLMIKDSVLADFTNDNNHIFRQILRENDMLGWAPSTPIKIHYCTQDEQVYYMNSIRADSAWRANGSTTVEIQNYGALNHGGCVEPALTSAAFWLLGKISTCTGISDKPAFDFQLYPNPARERILIIKEEGTYRFSLSDLHGRMLMDEALDEVQSVIDIERLPAGIYIASLRNGKGESVKRKVIIE
jgi:pimeloyl-ACP methyl ester carboxylesterase